MKNFIFFFGIWNYLLFNLSGSKIGFKQSNLNTFREAYEEHPSEFYNKRFFNVDDNSENSPMELLLKDSNNLAKQETKEIEEEIKAWFDGRLDALFYLKDFVEYEIYKKSLREDLEWYAVIYSDLPVLNALKNFVESL